MRGQGYWDLIISTIILLYSILILQSTGNYNFYIEKSDDIYSSVIVYDNTTGISFSTVENLYHNLSKFYDICIIYYNKSFGNCNDKHKEIEYLVWDKDLNKTVILRLKYK